MLLSSFVSQATRMSIFPSVKMADTSSCLAFLRLFIFRERIFILEGLMNFPCLWLVSEVAVLLSRLNFTWYLFFGLVVLRFVVFSIPLELLVKFGMRSFGFGGLLGWSADLSEVE